jgi:acyl-CoA synthetase (AMP-forming)/AMP-acid ligase II
MAAKIVDEEGNELGPEEVGELVLTNGLAIKEYWRNPQATKL